MTSLDLFLQPVKRWAPEAQDALVREAVQEAARLACANAPVWTSKESIGMMGPYNETVVSVPSSADLVDIEQLTLEDGTECKDWKLENNTLTVNKSWLKEGEVRLFYVHCVLKPKPGVNEVPDSAASVLSHVLPVGARSLLLDMPGQTWSNPETAFFYHQQFYSELASIRADIIFKKHRHAMSLSSPLA